MGRSVVAIADLSSRLPQAGRIRIGVKVNATSRGGKAYQRPQSIDTFRFTSHDREALDQVAVIYGGEVLPWTEPRADPGQFEVITAASVLRIVLPPDPLGGTPIYEHWTGGGCDRRCDGATCTRMVKGNDGPEQIDVPCLCLAEEALACDVHSRLSVILPDVRFGGVWRLDSKSWDAAQEWPGMVALLQDTQGKGLTSGVMRLEQRHKVVAGETRHYPAVVLGLTESMDALAAGHARFGALTAPVPAAGELVAGEAGDGDVPGVGLDAESSPAPNLDDDVVDAEIVSDDRTLADVLPVDASPSRALALARQHAAEYGVADLPTAIEQVSDYRLIARVLDELGCVETVG